MEDKKNEFNNKRIRSVVWNLTKSKVNICDVNSTKNISNLYSKVYAQAVIEAVQATLVPTATKINTPSVLGLEGRRISIIL